MNEPAPVSATASRPPERCPACGHPLGEEGGGSCCSLCGWELPDARITSGDRTPYAESLHAGHPRWWAMCAWVYTAGRPRLSFLSLLRPSRASRRFARRQLLLVAVTAGIATAANVGWFVVKAGPGTLATTRAPAGRGWFHVVSRPPGGMAGVVSSRVVATDAWWNLPIALMSGGAVLLAGWLLGHLLVGWVGRRAERLAAGLAGHEDRLRCAVHYSCAWALFGSVAGLFLSLRPVVAVLVVRGTLPSAPFVSGSLDAAAILSGLAGVLFWWFWLIRLAGTLPEGPRGRVHAHFLVWTPLIVVLVLGSAAAGGVALLDLLAENLRLNW